MPRAEAGSAKAIGNAIKAKGLTRLRWYCQICQKACRDANGYKCHIESEAHMRQMEVIGKNGAKVIDDFSKQFEREFVTLLSRRFGTRRVRANQVYQEYIQDRHHLHMNATRWVTLSEFVKHLGREGIAHVDENEQGWWISWVDNSPAALARQDALRKMERAKMDEEGRQRKLLAEQVERARELERRAGQASAPPPGPEVGLRREEVKQPVKIGISLSAKPAPPPPGDGHSTEQASNAEHDVLQKSSPAPGTSTATVSSLSAPASTVKPAAPIRLGLNPLKTGSSSGTSKAEVAPLGNALKGAGSTRPNVAKSSAPVSAASSRTSAFSAAERIMMEETERRRKRETMGPQPGPKRMRL